MLLTVWLWRGPDVNIASRRANIVELIPFFFFWETEGHSYMFDCFWYAAFMWWNFGMKNVNRISEIQVRFTLIWCKVKVVNGKMVNRKCKCKTAFMWIWENWKMCFNFGPVRGGEGGGAWKLLLDLGSQLSVVLHNDHIWHSSGANLFPSVDVSERKMNFK